MKIGFIGLGIMGRPMALNLIAAGHDLVRARSPQPRARKSGPPRRCVGDAAAVAEASRGHHPDGARHARRRGTCCSVRTASRKGSAPGQAGDRHVLDQPDRHQGFAERINGQGCDYLDAPVSGGEVGANQATPDHHGRRAGCRLRAGASRCSRRWAGTSPMSARQRHRPDMQGRQPDHRRAQHRGGRGGAAPSPASAGADPARVRAGADGRLRHPPASSKCTGSACSTRTFDARFPHRACTRRT